MDKRELRESIRREMLKDPAWRRDAIRMQEWFRVLYGREYDCEPDGTCSGRDSRVGFPLETALLAATPCQQCAEDATSRPHFVCGAHVCSSCGHTTFGHDSGWRSYMGWP